MIRALAIGVALGLLMVWLRRREETPPVHQFSYWPDYTTH